MWMYIVVAHGVCKENGIRVKELKDKLIMLLDLICFTQIIFLMLRLFYRVTTDALIVNAY